MFLISIYTNWFIFTKIDKFTLCKFKNCYQNKKKRKEKHQASILKILDISFHIISEKSSLSDTVPEYSIT